MNIRRKAHGALSRDPLIYFDFSSGKPLSRQLANSAIHGYDIGVSHFLQVVGGQRGAETAAAIEYEFSLQVGILALDVALDDALAQVDGSGQVVGVEFAVFADVDENEFVAAIEPRLDFVNVGFADALLGVVDNLQKARLDADEPW